MITLWKIDYDHAPDAIADLESAIHNAPFEGFTNGASVLIPEQLAKRCIEALKNEGDENFAEREFTVTVKASINKDKTYIIDSEIMLE